MTRRLALVVGDTAGHVMPALAVAGAYREHAGDVEVVVLAAAGGHASRLVPPAGIRLEIVPGAPLARTGPVGKAVAVGTTVRAVARARRILAREGSRLVIGSGGYASGGVLLAARSLGLRTAVIEPNVVPGLANRLLKRIAHRIYLTFPETRACFPADRSLVTGTPVMAELVPALLGIERNRVARGPRRLLVMGGSRGDAFLATRVPPLTRALKARGLDVAVRHQTGTVPPAEVERRYREAGVEATAEAYVDLARAYAEADLAIARAGAGTLAELALAGLPSLLVPLADAAADHQSDNARVFTAGGAAAWVREQDWTLDGVVERLWPWLSDADAWRLASEAARRRARPDAAIAIVEDCETQMRERW